MVNAHGTKFWKAILPVVFQRNKRSYEKLRGWKIGIDADFWIFDNVAHLRTLSRAALGNCQGYYEPTELVQSFFRRHEKLLNFGIEPTYVFSGQRDHPMILQTTLRVRNAQREFQELVAHRKLRVGKVTEGENVASTRYARRFGNLLRLTRDVDPQLPVFIGRALQEQGIRAVQAPFLARYQLVAWELDGTTDASWTERDGHFVGLGSRKLVLGGGSSSDRTTRLYQRDRDFVPGRCHHHVLAERKNEYLDVATVLFGCDYMHRLEPSGRGVQPKSLFQAILSEYIDAQDTDKIQGESSNRVDELMRGKWQMNSYQIERFQKAVNMFRYCPVLRQQSACFVGGTNGRDNAGSTSAICSNNNTNGGWEVVPLHPLPSNKTWKEMIGFEPSSQLPVGANDYGPASQFQQNVLSFNYREPSGQWYESVTPAFADCTPGGAIVQGEATNKTRPGGPLMRKFVARIKGKSLEAIEERAKRKKKISKDSRILTKTSELKRTPAGGRVVLDSSTGW